MTGLGQLGSVLSLSTQATGLVAIREQVATGLAIASASTGRVVAVPASPPLKRAHRRFRIVGRLPSARGLP